NHTDKRRQKQPTTRNNSSTRAPPNRTPPPPTPPATFKVRVNLVLVRVVVRDSDGKPVPNLKKEDFLLFDNRKPQAISTFSAETAASRAVKNVNVPIPAGDENPAPAEGHVAGLAQRFVAMLFDDVHLSMQDSVFVRKSAERFLGKLAPSDRVAMFSTSGQFSQDFTNDREALEKVLLSVVPRPRAVTPDLHTCPDINYYEADLIENKH